jgi:A/G-specific adenine glycosylase
VTAALLDWFRTHRRLLAWRKHPDPYRTWVAEVLLQQTRVAQAEPYFERFVRRFPTVEALARATPAQVLKAWQGAGYYARARNLHAAARTIRTTFGGKVPRSVAELETLPGVGPYTARAIASLAFDARELALEANGLRVAARWTREEGDLRSGPVRARLRATLEALLPAEGAGRFNEALMELGETVCRPVAPACEGCPVRFGCRAGRELSDPGRLPRRRGRARVPHVNAAVVVLAHAGRWLVQRRPSKGLLGGLWEFPGGKIEPGESPRTAARRELWEETGLRAPRLDAHGVVHHAYSHFTVTLHVFAGSLAERPVGAPQRRWVTPAELARLPLPRATEKVVQLVQAVPGRASPDSGSHPGRRPAVRRGGDATPPPRPRVRENPASIARHRAPR